MKHKYPIVKDGIFTTVQGEGLLLGKPMVFVRFAGCSVGCKECDTDYTAAERLSVAEIVERIQREKLLPVANRAWVWLTGGEPTDHDLRPLTEALRNEEFCVAMPTAGRKKLGDGWMGWADWCDHLMVSPHDRDGPVQNMGQELNVVPGLNGLLLTDVARWETYGFPVRRVTPLADSPASVAACIAFVRTHANWHLGIQAHKAWGLP